MSALLRLLPEGARLVTPELASGALAKWEQPAWKELVAPFSRELGLQSLDAALDRVLNATPPHSTAVDAEIAPLVHRHLRLSRREASDIGVFRFLAVVHRPDVVRHRWEDAAWVQSRSRFLRAGTRPDSNAFSRWWWIAELTRAGDDYAMTQRVFQRQALATAIFVRSISFHAPAVRACVSSLEDLEAPVIERAMLELSRTLALVPIEALDQPAVESELADIVSRLA